MKLKTYQELENDREKELETGTFERVRCANLDCGCCKASPGEGGYLPDGRWFHCWNCRTALVGAGKLFTAKITSWNNIVKFFTELGLIEETVLISVMRTNWRFLPKHAPIKHVPQLAPPIELRNETKSFYKTISPDHKELLAFQIRYSTIFVQYLEGWLNDDGTMGAEQELQDIIGLLRENKNVVLMCICDPFDFCHRIHLKEYLSQNPGIEERIVGELIL